MQRLTIFLAPRWFAVALLVLALILCLALLLVRWRGRRWSGALLFFSAAALLPSLGGLIASPDAGLWFAAIFAGLFFLQLLWLIITNDWSMPLAIGVASLMAFGLGAWITPEATRGFLDVGRVVAGVQVVHPWWLLILLSLPVVVAISFKSLAGLGPFRRWAAIGLRCLLIALLTLALAELRFRRPDDTVTVLFLIDRSLSVPPEMDASGQVDLRWERILRFIKESVEKRGDGHKRDKYGVIVFGRQPRLELPPSDAKRFRFPDGVEVLDSSYTDIAAAMKLALASFPEGSGKRIVLLSDGNENVGNAVEQARVAEKNGVQIDVVPLAAGSKNESEVMVQSVEAPPLTEQGARFPIKVLLRSYNPNPVIGTLTLTQKSGDQEKNIEPGPEHPKGRVTLRPGLNSITFPPPLERPTGSFTYKARFEPLGVLVDGRMAPPPRGHLQNKVATTHVLALGQRKVLLIEGKTPKDGEPYEHEFLYEHLLGLGKTKFKVSRVTAAKLAALDGEDFGRYLIDYDCIMLANVPAEAFSEEQQERLRSNTHEQGCGLIMIGGPDSFGAGGWQGTPIEKALPVDCDIKALKVQGKGGLALIFHASEADVQNSWQKNIGKLSIKKLAPMDMVGVLQYDGMGADGGTSWHVPFQTVGEKRDSLSKLLDKMNPGDMPDCNPSFRMALAALTNPKYDLAKKHIIFISDGDHWTADPQLLARMKTARVTCTTVCVTTHGQPEIQRMSSVASATGGKFYNVTNPKTLPEIYTKEARLVSQSFIYERKFTPKLVAPGGPADKLPENLDALYGFVRTTPKVSPLVQKAILGPPQGDQDFPILAYWQYGLGKSVAFTSDARSGNGRRTWDQDWADSPLYQRFWEQMVDWSLRAVETGTLTMTTEYRDGKVKVIVEARDKNNQNKPLTDLRLRGGVTPPSGKVEDSRRFQLKFEQKGSGQYEAEFKADEAGSYFINASPVRIRRVVEKVMENGKEVERVVEKVEAIDSARAGVTVPYSPEFADMESNVGLLEDLRRLTNGQTYADDPAALTQAAADASVFRAGLPLSRGMAPVWFWLLFLAALVLFFDIAVRRIALEPTAFLSWTSRVWDRLRGRVALADGAPQFLDRLKSRKQVVGETLEQGRGSARFDGGDGPEPPPGAEMAPLPDQPKKPTGPTPGVAPEKEQEAADFASRLMKAKKKVWEERDKGKS